MSNFIIKKNKKESEVDQWYSVPTVVSQYVRLIGHFIYVIKQKKTKQDNSPK